MRLSIIIIGDEILLGQVTDTNSGSIARAFGPMGWEVVRTLVVGDSAQAIAEAVSTAMQDSQLVITTGGLGPTKDDITKRVLLSIFGGELKEDPAVAANVRRIFDKRGLAINPLTMSQALVPTSCRVIQNELGTAPIMWFERDGRVLISMPGVPFETVGMLERAVVKQVRDRFASNMSLAHHTVVVTGKPESTVAAMLSAFEDELPEHMHLAYLPSPGYLRLRLDARSQSMSTAELQAATDAMAQRMMDVLGQLVLHDGDATPAEILLERLRQRGLTVASAESCTGGNIAHAITSVSGSSECYMGSIVSYSNDVKHRLLGVSLADLAEHGAVSEPVVRQMAEGAAAAVGTHCAMATSGIAGPGGGTPQKPVGTVWMAVHTPAGTVSKLCHLPGDRARVIDRATTEAIIMLIKALDDPNLG